MGTSNPETLRQLATQREISTVLAKVKQDTEAIREALGTASDPPPEFTI